MPENGSAGNRGCPSRSCGDDELQGVRRKRRRQASPRRSLSVEGFLRSGEDHLDIGVFGKPFIGELDAEAGLLDAAEGHIRLNGAVLVDLDGAAGQPLRHSLGSRNIRAPHRTAEAVFAVVGETGKFHGVIEPTTPSGLRCSSTRPCSLS